MAASRSPSGPPDGAQGAPSNGSFPAGAIPHGYDQCEFLPEQCTRDFGRSRRPREPDEERRQLRSAAAAIGDARPAFADRPAARTESWSRDEDIQSVNGASRLYKD